MGFNALASGANATAVGANAAASGANATAVGESAQAGFESSTAIGRGAVTTRASQVAIGTGASTYTLAGLPSAASLAAQVGPTRFVTTDASGNLAASSFGPDSIGALSSRVDGLGARVDGLGARVDQLSNRVDALSRYAVESRREARGGTAMSIASAQIRYDDRPGKISLGTGLGTFKGETGIAAGLGFTSPDQNWRANLSASSSFRGDWGVGAGVTFTLN